MREYFATELGSIITRKMRAMSAFNYLYQLQIDNQLVFFFTYLPTQHSGFLETYGFVQFSFPYMLNYVIVAQRLNIAQN